MNGQTGAVTMATITLDGFDELSEMFRELAPIPDDVLTDALNDMAKVAEAAVRQQGQALGVKDPQSQVHILDKIIHTKPKKTKDGGVSNVTFSGSRTRGRIRTRNAEIAFINEYGKRGQAPRPFIRLAAESAGDSIADAGEKVIGEWWDKQTGN